MDSNENTKQKSGNISNENSDEYSAQLKKSMKRIYFVKRKKYFINNLCRVVGD